MPDIRDYEPLFGRWTVGKRLGAGGFGDVYEIYREELGITQRAAVKRISIPGERLEEDPRILERVKTEIKTMLNMKGANHIVGIEEFAVENWKRDNGRDILIRMELLTSLASVIKKEVMQINEVIKLGCQICKMLEICEKNDIIHRDIKPANLFVSQYGDYKLGDFGIARTLEDGKASTFIGTKEFLAPEVFKMPNYDLRADIYSLGIMLYYLLNNNKMPFESEDGEKYISMRIDGEALPPLNNVPDWLSRIVLKACSYRPEDRYKSPSEMREALEAGGKADVSNHISEIIESRSTFSTEFSGITAAPKIGGAIDFGGRRWRVLDAQNGKALLLSEKIIEKRKYNEQYTNITWADCALRGYLNGEFYNTFGSRDKALIAETKITTEDNPWFGAKGGNAANDRIFLLSIEESAQYFGDSGQLKNRPGVSSIKDRYNSARIATDEAGRALWWWLRSPGCHSRNAAFVSTDGFLNVSGIIADSASGGVRPALWLNL